MTGAAPSYSYTQLPTSVPSRLLIGQNTKTSICLRAMPEKGKGADWPVDTLYTPQIEIMREREQLEKLELESLIIVFY